MNNYISPFQMIKTKVVNFSISQNDIEEKDKSVLVRLGADYEVSDVAEMDGKRSGCVLLKIFLKGTVSDEKVFQIILHIKGWFEGDGKQMEAVKFNDMLEINGITALMQLGRAYITSTTALAGFDKPIHFPMVNVFELVKSKKADVQS